MDRKPVKQQVKVVELIGHKLDPNAKYLFVLDERAFHPDNLELVHRRLADLIGHNFVFAFTNGIAPRDALVVHEIMPEEQPYPVMSRTINGRPVSKEEYDAYVRDQKAKRSAKE